MRSLSVKQQRPLDGGTKAYLFMVLIMLVHAAMLFAENEATLDNADGKKMISEVAGWLNAVFYASEGVLLIMAIYMWTAEKIKFAVGSVVFMFILYKAWDPIVKKITAFGG
jgi:hypothetical protein